MYVEEGYTKAMMQFVKLAAKWGAKPVKTTGKHLKFRDALGNQISAPKTSSDFRAIRNFKSELKNRGFVQQLPKSKVAKDKSIVQEPVTPTVKTSGQQTTFKDFMNKIRPIVTDLKKPSTTASRYEKGWRKAIKELPASEKFRMGDDIIRQLRREGYREDWKNNLKLNYQYGERNKPENYLPKDSVKDAKKLKLKTAQLAPLEKENQLPGKYSKIVVTTDTPADRMDSLKKRVGRYGKGLQRMSDIYPNYP